MRSIICSLLHGFSGLGAGSAFLTVSRPLVLFCPLVLLTRSLHLWPSLNLISIWRLHQKVIYCYLTKLSMKFLLLAILSLSSKPFSFFFNSSFNLSISLVFWSFLFFRSLTYRFIFSIIGRISWFCPSKSSTFFLRSMVSFSAASRPFFKRINSALSLAAKFATPS